jgi:hypothetical protein
LSFLYRPADGFTSIVGTTYFAQGPKLSDSITRATLNPNPLETFSNSNDPFRIHEHVERSISPDSIRALEYDETVRLIKSLFELDAEPAVSAEPVSGALLINLNPYPVGNIIPRRPGVKVVERVPDSIDIATKLYEDLTLNPLLPGRRPESKNIPRLPMAQQGLQLQGIKTTSPYSKFETHLTIGTERPDARCSFQSLLEAVSFIPKTGLSPEERNCREFLATIRAEILKEGN